MSAGQALKTAATGPGPQTQRSAYEIFRSKLAQCRTDLKSLLGGDQAVARFERVVLNAVQQNPDLLEANGRTLLLACMKAAQDRLLPDGREAVLNIYNTKVKTDKGEQWVKAVQYLPMVRGLIKLMWETGQFTMLDAVAVNQRDYFEFRRGDEPRIEHEPYAGEDDPGPVVAAYFIGKMKNGEIKREVMYRRDIEKARAASKTPDKGPWGSWYDQMAIKSVVHRVFKQLPGMPEDVERVIVSDMAGAASITGAFDAGAPAPAPMAALPQRAGGEAPPAMNIRTEPEYVQAVQSEEEEDLRQSMERNVDPDTGEIRQQQTGSAGPTDREAFEEAMKLAKAGKYEDAQAVCPPAHSKELQETIDAELERRVKANQQAAQQNAQATPARSRGR